MINAKIKSTRGISLVSLVIATVVLLILANVIIYNVRDNLRVGKLRDMQNDIENLRDKISSYYAQYGMIPASVEYTNISDIQTAGLIGEEDEINKFYVIDLGAIENLTLTYGQDYEKIRKGEVTTSKEINDLKDLYIINEVSHNIFYVKGITLDGEIFYTDYTKNDVDKEKVNLINVENITGNWSPIYDENAIYKDKNEDIAYIPERFRVSMTPGENTINDGLVVKGPDGSEFVWIPVSTVISDTEEKGTENKAMAINLGTEDEPIYRGLLYNFSEDTSEVIEGCTQTTDDNREPYNLGTNYDNDTNISNWTQTLYQEEYNRTIESIKRYGGFYVGRYETSINEETETVVSKPGNMPMSAADYSGQAWYGMYNKQKEYANKNGLESLVESSMIWGSQYDAIMNWILTNSKERSKVTASTQPKDGRTDIAKTGTNVDDKMSNIYDLGNNLREWTLEANKNTRVNRGGAYYNNNSPSSRDSYVEPNYTSSSYGSRLILYLQ